MRKDKIDQWRSRCSCCSSNPGRLCSSRLRCWETLRWSGTPVGRTDSRWAAGCGEALAAIRGSQPWRRRPAGRTVLLRAVDASRRRVGGGRLPPLVTADSARSWKRCPPGLATKAPACPKQRWRSRCRPSPSRCWGGAEAMPDVALVNRSHRHLLFADDIAQTHILRVAREEMDRVRVAPPPVGPPTKAPAPIMGARHPKSPLCASWFFSSLIVIVLGPGRNQAPSMIGLPQWSPNTIRSAVIIRLFASYHAVSRSSTSCRVRPVCTISFRTSCARRAPLTSTRGY